MFVCFRSVGEECGGGRTWRQAVHKDIAVAGQRSGDTLPESGRSYPIPGETRVSMKIVHCLYCEVNGTEDVTSRIVHRNRSLWYDGAYGYELECHNGYLLPLPAAF